MTWLVSSLKCRESDNFFSKVSQNLYVHFKNGRWVKCYYHAGYIVRMKTDNPSLFVNAFAKQIHNCYKWCFFLFLNKHTNFATLWKKNCQIHDTLNSTPAVSSDTLGYSTPDSDPFFVAIQLSLRYSIIEFFIFVVFSSL